MEAREFMSVGDIISFPRHAESKAELLPGATRVRMSQGVPGKFKVTAIDDDGTVHLEPIPLET